MIPTESGPSRRPTMVAVMFEITIVCCDYVWEKGFGCCCDVCVVVLHVARVDVSVVEIS